MTVYFLFLDDCSKCKKTRKEVLLPFMQKHPEIPVVEWELSQNTWSFRMAPPEITPAFVVVRQGFKPKTVQGDVFATPEDLYTWATAF